MGLLKKDFVYITNALKNIFRLNYSVLFESVTLFVLIICIKNDLLFSKQLYAQIDIKYLINKFNNPNLIQQIKKREREKGVSEKYFPIKRKELSF
jgi:hypothetical protein